MSQANVEAFKRATAAGVRDYFGDLHDTFDEIRSEFPEIRDLENRIIAIGHLRARGMVSRAETESPLA